MNLRNDNPCSRVEPVLGPGPQRNIVQHMRALPHREVAAAVATVRASREQPAVRLAFEFLVLTASRSGEVRWCSPPGAAGRCRSSGFARLLELCGIAYVPLGFRSSFRDWAAEETDHPREVIEAAPAHVVGDNGGGGDGAQQRLISAWSSLINLCRSSRSSHAAVPSSLLESLRIDPRLGNIVATLLSSGRASRSKPATLRLTV